jgi:hypothetical protein
MNQQTMQAGTPHREVITQAQMARFKELTALGQERETLRKQLLRALEAGATIEEGPLVPDYTKDNTTRMTVKYLVEALRLDWVKVRELRSKSPVRTFHYLSIRQRPSSASQATLLGPRTVGRRRPPPLQTDSTDHASLEY